jgi:hypothetical protein
MPQPRTPLLFLPLLLVACREVDPLPATGELTTEIFHSEVVGDDYLLRIRLPPDYDPAATPGYPLIIQLDPTFAGLQQYAITVGLVSDAAARQEWPEAIVVGLDYPTDPGLRERDYALPDPPDPTFSSDGADAFHRMLAEELIPRLEAEHAIDSSRRVLLGHSNGGVFAWYAAFRHDEGAPPLFSAIVAADTGYTEPLFTYERWHAERAADLPVAIFATRATYNGAVQQIGFEAMLERLESRDHPNLALASAVLETDHGGAVWPSYELGLDFILAGEP